MHKVDSLSAMIKWITAFKLSLAQWKIIDEIFIANHEDLNKITYKYISNHRCSQYLQNRVFEERRIFGQTCQGNIWGEIHTSTCKHNMKKTCPNESYAFQVLEKKKKKKEKKNLKSHIMFTTYSSILIAPCVKIW